MAVQVLSTETRFGGAPRIAERIRSSLNAEGIIVAILALGLLIALTGLKTAKTADFQGDTAMFFQTTQNIATRGVPMTNVGESSIWTFKYRLAAKTAAELARDPLAASPVREGNLFAWHTYFILYAVALFARIMPVQIALLGSYVLSFLGTIVLTYWILRRNGLPIGAAASFCVLVMTYAGWSDGLQGQFFPDRLFLLPALAFMFLISKQGASRAGLIVMAVLCASITERAPLIAGGFTVVYVALNWRSASDRYFKAALGMVLLAMAAIAFHSLANTENGSYLAGSVGQLLHWFSRPEYLEKTTLFVLVNLTLLAIAFFEWRAAVVAMLLMVPNVIGTIGGSEKVGWAGAYHSYYMPALIWAAIAGFTALYRKTNAGAKWAPYAAVAVLVAYAALLNPFSYARIDFSPANVSSTFFPQLASDLRAYSGGAFQFHTKNDEAIRQAVPEGSSVSADESAMPILYKNRTLDFFPLNVDHADYAVVSTAALQDPQHVAITAGGIGFNVNHLGGDEAKSINDVIFARMKRDGYDLAHPLVFVPPGLAVIKRLH